MDDPFLADKGLSNYWGYSTLGYFAPELRYSAAFRQGEAGGAVREFKEMVKALHAAGLEVILDGTGISSTAVTPSLRRYASTAGWPSPAYVPCSCGGTSGCRMVSPLTWAS